ITGQAALVGFLFIAPIVWPQVLPRATFVTLIAAPGAPPPPPAASTAVRPKGTTQPNRSVRLPFVEPRHIPAQAQMIVDDPAPGSSGSYGPGAVRGTGPGVPGALGAIFAEGTRPPAPVPNIAEPAHTAKPAETVAQPTRIRVSELQLA